MLCLDGWKYEKQLEIPERTRSADIPGLFVIIIKQYRDTV